MINPPFPVDGCEGLRAVDGAIIEVSSIPSDTGVVLLLGNVLDNTAAATAN
jgi:hypothetical protein